MVACAANDEGAKSVESDLERLAGLSGTLSKHHCRVAWSRIDPETVDAALLGDWHALDAPRAIADGRFLSRPGVFAWDRIDAASALLAMHLPADLAGRAADLGCGYGYLATELLARCPRIVSLDLYEAEARALDLARRNLETARVPMRSGFGVVGRRIAVCSISVRACDGASGGASGNSGTTCSSAGPSCA